MASGSSAAEGPELPAPSSSESSRCPAAGPWAEDHDEDASIPEEWSGGEASLDCRVSIRRPRPVVAGSPPAVACGPLVIFDWDDTLLPTTFLEEQQPSPLPFLLAALRSHGHLVASLLRRARQVARVAIVTLSRRPWVAVSAARFFDDMDFVGLLQELDITIYYVAEHTEMPEGALNEFSAITCKRNAMARCLDDIRGSGKREGPQLNAISIGDSTVELQALKELLSDLRDSGDFSEGPLCKTVKLLSTPTLNELGDELEQIVSWIQPLIFWHKDLDVRMVDPLEHPCKIPIGLGHLKGVKSGQGFSSADVPAVIYDAV